MENLFKQDLSVREIQKIDRTDYNVFEEVRKVQEFAKANDLILPENFLKSVRAGDIIEIYAFPEHKQIYANQEFSRISSYSAEQMTTVPFQKLFWRSDEVQRQLVERAALVASQGSEAVEWGLEVHELVENLHPRKRTFEMKMGWISPCLHTATHKRCAWASTLQVQLIYEWPISA